MKRLILLVFVHISFLGAMEEKKFEKIYVRVIATEGKKAFIETFVKEVGEMKNFLKNKFIKESFVSPQQAELWAGEFIQRDIMSSCGLMQGFFGDKVYLKQWIDFLLKKECGFCVMYHDKEPTYERIGLTDSLIFLDGSAYLQDCALKEEIQVKLKNFRELPFFEGERDAYLADSELNQGHAEKVLGTCSGIKKDKDLPDAKTQAAVILALSNRPVRGIKKNNRVVLPEDLLSVSDESSSVSSCSSKMPACYVNYAPSPLYLPVRSIIRGEIAPVIEKP